ncbi:hypothetical protein OAI07_01875 [Akkermansiaceae bacterium]|nr:hypothetical protein [Akkermansiaceae bacterium]
MNSKTDIFILSAGYGEGHNSAAWNIHHALEAHRSTLLLDPCALGSPFTNEKIRSLYRLITTHTPWIWEKIYNSTEKQDFSKSHIPLMRKPEKLLAKLITQHQPKVIISTYPIYPYFLERIYANSPLEKPPIVTLVTDSMEINAAWRKAPTDFWLVTEARTRNTLIEQGLPESKILETGFPVHPHFADLTPVSAEDDLKPFKMLYFPTAKKPHVRRISKELLEAAGENSSLTIVLGRNTKNLHSRAQDIKDIYKERVTIKGWTKKVPELLNSHHVVIGKAGGATVHEALAAACPMIIHHLVPGQEQGNLNLLRQLKGGQLADKPGDLSACIREMLTNDAHEWRTMKRNLLRQARPAAAETVAKFILSQIS